MRGAVVAVTLAAAIATQLTGADAQTAALSVPTGSGEAGYAVNLFGAQKVTVAKGATVSF